MHFSCNESDSLVDRKWVHTSVRRGCGHNSMCTWDDNFSRLFLLVEAEVEEKAQEKAQKGHMEARREEEEKARREEGLHPQL